MGNEAGRACFVVIANRRLTGPGAGGRLRVLTKGAVRTKGGADVRKAAPLNNWQAVSKKRLRTGRAKGRCINGEAGALMVRRTGEAWVLPLSEAS